MEKPVIYFRLHNQQIATNAWYSFFQASYTFRLWGKWQNKRGNGHAHRLGMKRDYSFCVIKSVWVGSCRSQSSRFNNTLNIAAKPSSNMHRTHLPEFAWPAFWTWRIAVPGTASLAHPRGLAVRWAQTREIFIQSLEARPAEMYMHTCLTSYRKKVINFPQDSWMNYHGPLNWYISSWRLTLFGICLPLWDKMYFICVFYDI